MDVAQVLANLMSIPQIAGTLSLPGPSTLTMEYVLDLVSSVTYIPPSRAPVLPKSIALALAKVAQAPWWPLISPDEVERRYLDDVDVPGDWKAVGVVPDEIENHAITYLRRYRSAYVSCRLYVRRGAKLTFPLERTSCDRWFSLRGLPRRMPFPTVTICGPS
jgi:NADH dehydrogenase (ubiquinone) 1 alpha subcomplex subunit 9